MKALGISLFPAVLSIGSPAVYARGGGHTGHALGHHTGRYCETCPRDTHWSYPAALEGQARVHVSDRPAAWAPWLRGGPYRPAQKGGCDGPANMQWQTIKEAKQKDQ